MNISDLNKAEVLAALYNGAKPQGMGLLHYTPKDMTVAQAQEILDGWGMRFDYLKGRVMKIDISKDEVRTVLYNRDNGPGAAEIAISEMSMRG